MANARDILAQNGIKRPDITIRAAQACGLDLASAATMLIGESGGGRMIWGSDGVSTGGTYVKGGPVTRENYLAYRAAMRAGKIGRQGVGDAQLTSAEYQDRGDALGGCWDPYANQLAGFTGLARLQKAYGLQQGFRRYNGSGPLAEKYGRDKMAARTVWAARLAGATISAPAAASAPSPQIVSPTPRRHRGGEDNSMYFETPAPPAEAAKIDWPRLRRVYAFDPIGGWGGKCILRVNFGPRGGWLHLARWWIRLPDWSPNNRNLMKFWDHPIGAKGTDFAIAADWQTAPPVGASSIELDLSAPDGVHIQMIYEK